MQIELNINGKIEQIVVIADVDDADFCTSGDDCETKMQKIVSCYLKTYEATGGKVQKEKVYVYCWKWENNKFRMLK